MESNTSPAPGVIPEPAVVHVAPAASPQRDNSRAVGTSNTRGTTRRTPLARLLAALRGDKYMVDAYPPAVPPTDEG
jgi:hypothetical protein